MPTNRTRIRRPRKVEISEELLTIFMRSKTLEQKYHACMDNDCAWKVREDEHCPDCLEHFALKKKMMAMGGLPTTWTPDGLADTPEPPKCLIRASTRAAWRRSWKLRQELIKAANARFDRGEWDEENARPI